MTFRRCRLALGIMNGLAALDQGFLFLTIPGPLVDFGSAKMKPLCQSSDECTIPARVSLVLDFQSGVLLSVQALAAYALILVLRA